jgi:hypothetical protein
MLANGSIEMIMAIGADLSCRFSEDLPLPLLHFFLVFFPPELAAGAMIVVVVLLLLLLWLRCRRGGRSPGENVWGRRQIAKRRRIFGMYETPYKPHFCLDLP